LISSALSNPPDRLEKVISSVNAVSARRGLAKLDAQAAARGLPQEKGFRRGVDDAVKRDALRSALVSCGIKDTMADAMVGHV